MMTEDLVLGIDPDTKSTAFCIASYAKVHEVLVVRQTVTKEGEDPEITEVLQSVRMLAMTPAVLETIFSRHPGIRMAVVEGQQIYSDSPARPADLIKLAHVAGGIVGQLLANQFDVSISMPLPSAWKKQIPKAIQQGRTYNHYGWLFDTTSSYAYPTGCARAAATAGFQKVRKGEWKHVGDAMGLALYGAKALSSLAPDGRN